MTPTRILVICANAAEPIARPEGSVVTRCSTWASVERAVRMGPYDQLQVCHPPVVLEEGA